MCDCSDEVNLSSIPVGPPGPQGPPGAGPVLGGTSTTGLTVGTGTTLLTTELGLGFVDGGRVNIVSADLTKTMGGLVTDYTADQLTVEVNYTIGSGFDNDWTISIAGDRGAQGIQGIQGVQGIQGIQGVAGADGSSTSTTIDTNATPLGGLAYQIPLVGSDFVVDGMVLFVEDAGYYEVISSGGGGLPLGNITVTDLAYTGNNPANLLAGKKVTAAGLQGDAGTNGTDGFNYETTDGNGLPAQASGPYEFLMRNSGDTGYTFVSLAELKILLNSIPS